MLQNFVKVALLVGIFTMHSYKIIRAGTTRGVEHVIGFNGKPDMLFPPSRKPNSFGRSILKNSADLWTSEGVLFFYSALDFDASQRCMIEKAAALIAKYACIPVRVFQISKRCGKRKDTLHCVFEYPARGDDVDAYPKMMAAGISDDIRKSLDYVKIGTGEGCSAMIGRLGGRQPMSLDANCFYEDGGTVLHEMFHALGHAHEHQRFDRNSYIKLLTKNILSNRKENFYKLKASEFKDFGPYQYGSLMHYPQRAMSKDAENLDTIEPLQDTGPLPLGQRTHLIMSDMIKIRAVTSCSGQTYIDHQNLLLTTGKASLDEKEFGKRLSLWNDCRHLGGRR